MPDFLNFLIVFKLQPLQYRVFCPLQHHHSQPFTIQKYRLDAPHIFKVRIDFKKHGAGLGKGGFLDKDLPPPTPSQGGLGGFMMKIVPVACISSSCVICIMMTESFRKGDNI